MHAETHTDPDVTAEQRTSIMFALYKENKTATTKPPKESVLGAFTNTREP